MTAYYNENDPKTVAWLRELIKAGLIADGEVDDRSIVDVEPRDLRGFCQCHFFAGIGGWSYALRLSGWPDDKPVWTGSCPCQPFSQAATIHGRKGFGDERHLWPAWKELISERRPTTVFGEQSAAAIDWLRLVRSDLVEMGYAVGCVPIEAASVGADHSRGRFWFVADADFQGESVLAFDAEVGSTSLFASDAVRQGLSERGNSVSDRLDAPWVNARGRPSDEAQRALRRHRENRPILGSGIHGIPGRVGAVRGFGNAIVPQVAAAFIEAYVEAVNGFGVEPSPTGSSL